MNANGEKIILQLIGIANQLSSGKRKLNLDIENIDDIEDEKIKELAQKLVRLGEQYRDCYGFIMDLASGKLYTEAPRGNPFADPFKQLHSDLRHLTWQIQEIANGDYDQSVSFSGDFSEAINKMTAALRERQTLAEINRENEHLFESIFSTSPDGIILCDLDNKIVNLSNAAQNMLHIKKEDIDESLRFFDLIADEDAKKGSWLFDALLQGTPTIVSELKIMPRNAAWFWSEQNATILRDSNGNPKGFIIIFRDITERKESEEQLLKFTVELDESNKAKDKLFSIIAHDLKNPFNALLGFSSFLLKEIESGNMEKIRKYAMIIHDSATKGFELLINLLDWSRLQSNRIVVSPEHLNLNDIVEHNIDIGNTTAVSKLIRLSFANPGNYPVISDKAILNTILRNLIGNAVKYTPSNGDITVSVFPNGDGSYQISVKDSGTGIKKEDLEKLFQPDAVRSTPGTNQEKGSGLGLILCKDFVTKLGGKIWAESVYGYGSLFSFTLQNLANGGTE